MDRSENTLEGNEAQESIGWDSAATSDNTTDSSDEESLEVEPIAGPPSHQTSRRRGVWGGENGGKAGVVVTRHGGRRGENSEGPECASRGKSNAVKRGISGNGSNLRIGSGEESGR